MKKILFLLLMLLIGIRVYALSFEDAYLQTDKTPMVSLIYAEWADDYQNYLNTFRQIQPDFSNKFNFVELNIASKDAKYFNSKYHIYPNLPYILMYRDGGKVSRYIPRDCAADSNCVISKLKSFIQ